MLFVNRLQALHDLDSVRHRWLVHIDLLEAAHQGAVFLEVRAVFLVGRGADAAERAEASAGFSRLEASIDPPDVAPAPMTVWISSMNRMHLGVLQALSIRL